MTILQLTPHQGIGPILLGSSRTQAREALSNLGFLLESSRRSLDFFCDASIQTECGPDGKIWFIGISACRQFTVLYKGQNIFSLSAPDLFTLIAASEKSAPHAYTRVEYLFPDQLITLWDADRQYDRLGNETKPIWAQVGIGNSDYAAAFAAI